MQTWPLWKKRAVIIGSVVVLASLTAFMTNFFDQKKYDEEDLPFVAQRVAQSDATLMALLQAPQHMEAGDYGAAVSVYEEQLARLSEIPVEQVSSYFGDAGLAHYYLGTDLRLQGDTSGAREHFLRAAFMFEQAAETAHQMIFVTVAQYYRALAYYAAHDYGQVRDAGEMVLALHPEIAIELDFLPEQALAVIKEVLAISYFTLAEQANTDQAAVLQANGMRYAQEAIAESPDAVIQPHYYLGLAAHEAGDAESTKFHLTAFLAQMERIPGEHWDDTDKAAVSEARAMVTSLP